VITTQIENESLGNLTKNETLNETPALPAEKINESGRHLIYINESEFYKNRTRSWSACYGFECFTPAERRGQASIDYFKSLNLTDDFIYVIMQFDALGGDPTVEQMSILAADNITLFEYHGDHSYYAKVPRAILETKSYDFVRWIGITENPLMKMDWVFRYIHRNCTGSVRLRVLAYDIIDDKEFAKLQEIAIRVIGAKSGQYDQLLVDINPSKIDNLLTLNFVERIEWYSPPSLATGSLSSGVFSNITCVSPVNAILSFDGPITNELYNKTQEISEQIIVYESPDKPMCVLINPIYLFNPVDSFKLTRVVKGFMIVNDSYSIVAADETTKAILKDFTC